jgi:hypothetical protein
MSDITVTGNQAYFNEDSKFFKDVYIYGTLYYEFPIKPKTTFNDVDILGNLNVLGNSTFTSATFTGDVYLDNNLSVGILTVRTRLDVGIGGTILTTSTGKIGIGTAQPLQTLDVNGIAIISEKVGIGSITPEQKLDILGSVKIDEFIYDSNNSPGSNGYYLSMDADGIRWTGLQPSADIQGIFIQDEGVYVPTTGIAKSFTVLNFTQINSLGVGTDNLIPIENPTNPNFIADIQTKDYWGFNSSGNIYRMTNVGIQNSNPTSTLDITGTLHATGAVDFDSSLNVDGAATLNSTLDVDGATTLNSTLDVDGATTLNSTLDVDGATTLNSTLDVDGATTLNLTLDVDGATTLNNTLDVDGATTLNSTLDVDGATTLNNTLDVDGDVTFNSSTESTNKDTGALITQGGVGIEKNLNVGGNTKLIGTLELDSSLIDINGQIAGPSVGKTDYRLASVGTGVSWRPAGVETQNTIWVTKDGNDLNTGFLEGDAKATIGGAAAIAEPGDTIVIRPGVYTENNPIGLRTDVTVTGQDLRLVTVRPLNVTKDVFHVRRGCLIENINFAGSSVSIAHTGCGAVAFPPTTVADQANSGYIAPGPANEGPTGRWRSPYIRNCTNFMTGSIGMKINGDHATASTPGNDLKCMVCDSFTQYNENGIGVSITNNGYAQLVSIFTINCDIGIYADSGGSCDLTNSNSSFGNYGLYAVGIGSTEFTGTVGTYPPTRGQTGVDAGSDIVAFENVGNSRRPYDGQTLFFKINLSNYPDAVGSGVITEPMVEIQEIVVTNGGSGYSPASPPTIIIIDTSDNSQQPKGPQGIIAELSPTIAEVSGAITTIDVVNSGRNYLSTQNLEVLIDGGTATAEVITRPIYYAIDSATENSAGITTVTFTEFIPYELFGSEEASFRRISRILTSSHSFEYIGTGTDINTATPFTGGVPIKANEIVALDGAQVPFTSTDQKGNFDIGEGFQINQPTSTIRGRDFSKAIQAEITPIILALR